MAIYSNGINGPFVGKVGAVVGTIWNGKAVMRSVPKRRTKPFSPKELQQQAKFSLMSGFLKPVISLLNQTFKPLTQGVSGYNKAFSFNVKNAVMGEMPSLKVNYSMVLLGRGDLPNADSVVVESSAPGQLRFTWTDNSGTGLASSTDKAYVAIYHEALKIWIGRIAVATRSDGSFTLDAPGLAGSVQTFIGFISENEKNASDSFYSGSATIGP